MHPVGLQALQLPSLETKEPEDSLRDLSRLPDRGLLTQSPGVTPHPLQQAVDRTQQQALLAEGGGYR